MLTERDEPLTHAPESGEAGWFDRFWVNAHSLDGRTTVSQGLGIYRNAGVVDAFAIVVRGREQRTVRASRALGADPGALEAGPIAAEIVAPLRRWRFRLGPANDAGISYDFTFTGAFAPIDCGRMRDWSHFVQAGSVAGGLTIDGERIALDPAGWRAGRDRSWGRRPETNTRFNWVCAQSAAQHVWYLAVENAAGEQRVAQGFVRAGDRVEKLARIERKPAFGPAGEFRSAEVLLETESGRAISLAVRRLASSVYLRGGLYGGLRGWRQGDTKGALHVESERWALDLPGTLHEAEGLTDHVCEIRIDGADGVGIFELNHGT
ncbi:MAG: hypothetical protein ACREJT_11965 [Myxococcota bacterium]